MLKKLFYISFFVLLAILIRMTIPVSLADTSSVLQAKIQASTQNRANLEKEIVNYQTQLTNLNSQAATLQNTIKSLDISSNKISAEIKLTKNNIDDTISGIEDTKLKIHDKVNLIDRNTLVIRNTIQQIDRADSDSILETLLSSDQLSTFWNDLEALSQLQTKIRDQIVVIKSAKTDLEKAKTDMEKEKARLEIYNKRLADQNLILQSTKKDKNTLLANTKNSQASYSKILAQKKALMNALDQEIAQYESQLRLAIDPKSYPRAGKGILAWPLLAINITQKFGYTTFAKTAYATGFHNGVDFAASIGSQVMSAGNGTIDGIGDTDNVCPGASFGKWVFIRYDNGLASIYGHLSLITSKPGQRVNTGDVIAYSGNTGYSTGPHLHMSVYAGQGVKISTLKSAVCKGTYTVPMADSKAYLDPLVYL